MKNKIKLTSLNNRKETYKQQIACIDEMIRGYKNKILNYESLRIEYVKDIDSINDEISKLKEE